MHILALSKAAGQRVGAGGARGRLRAQQPPRSRARLVRPRLTGIIELYHRLEALPPDLLSYTLRKLRPWDRAPAAATNRLLRATLAAGIRAHPRPSVAPSSGLFGSRICGRKTGLVRSSGFSRPHDEKPPKGGTTNAQSSIHAGVGKPAAWSHCLARLLWAVIKCDSVRVPV